MKLQEIKENEREKKKNNQTRREKEKDSIRLLIKINSLTPKLIFYLKKIMYYKTI